MKFEWDETKRLANLAKHNIDFVRAAQVFAAPHLILPARSTANEPRWLAIGTTGGIPVAVIFTRRETRVRIISIRRARTNERRELEALYR